MVGTIKAIVKRTIPEFYRTLQKTRQSYALYRLVRKMRPIERAVVKAQGLVVQGGPFQGMTYIHRTHGSAFLPKLLGCYEAELHPALERIFAKRFDQIVNIGCGEGYYAVGLARRFAGVPVWAFDTDARAREACRQLAEKNGMAERVHVEGACGAKELQRLTAKSTLVICDCEGYERELLRPEHFTNVRGSDVIVELHDSIDPTISGTILSRFTPTHEATLMEQSTRNLDAYPALRAMRSEQKRLAVDEFRPAGIRWAYLRPHSGTILRA